MDKQSAKQIAKLLDGIAVADEAAFVLAERIEAKPLTGFHHWADGQPCEGAFLLKDQAGEGLWVLVIDWRADGDYYVVLFPESRSGPVAEIHQLIEDGAGAVLQWRYSPTKRDGRNEERKAYFIEAFGSEHVRIAPPRHEREVEDFVDELFTLARSRMKADRLDPDRPAPREGFPEGKLKEKLHLARERNRALIQQAKRAALERDGCLRCACCGFDFHATYGECGKGFIEAHHTKPVSELAEDGEEVRVEDLALVCSNCHRMLHRRRPWLRMDELSALLAANQREEPAS